MTTRKAQQSYITDMTKKTLSQAEMSKLRGELFFRRSLQITAIGAALITFGMFTAVSLFPVDQVMSTLDKARPWLAGWRLLLFVVLIGGWRKWSGYYRVWGYLDNRQYQTLVNLRWRVAMWMIIIELVLNQGIMIEFLNALFI